MIYVFSWQAQKSGGIPPTRAKFFVKAQKKRMEPLQKKQRGRYVYVKCSFVYYLFKIENCLTSLIYYNNEWSS
jgi:hypothetical protein